MNETIELFLIVLVSTYVAHWLFKPSEPKNQEFDKSLETYYLTHITAIHELLIAHLKTHKSKDQRSLPYSWCKIHYNELLRFVKLYNSLCKDRENYLTIIPLSGYLTIAGFDSTVNVEHLD